MDPRNRSLRALLLLVGALIFAKYAATQSDSKIKFSASTELVLVPAVVTDRTGSHIKGLQKADFVVLEDGVERPISTFEEVTTSAERVKRRSEGVSFFSNQYDNISTPKRITVIVLDFINTTFTDQAKGRRQVLQYLDDGIDVHEPTALFVLTPSGPKVVHSFTSDTRILAGALKELHLTQTPLASANPVGAPTEIGGNATLYSNSEEAAEAKAIKQRMGEALRELQQQSIAFQTRASAEITLQGMQQIAHALESVPGRKALIWLSGGFPFAISDSQAFDKLRITQGTERNPLTYSDDLGTMLPVYSRTWEALNAAQVAVYPIDMRGLVNQYYINPSTQRPDKNYIAQGSWLQNEILGTFDNFAAMTGGRAFYNSNDLKLGMREAVNDSSQYYVLGYNLGKNTRKEAWHKLEVRVRVAGAKVRSRTGFVVTRQKAVSTDDLDAAIHSPLEFTGIPILVRWIPREESSRTKLSFELSVPAGKVSIDSADRNHISLQVVNVTKKADGSLSGQPQSKNFEGSLDAETVKQLRTSGFIYTGEVEPNKDAAETRFIVRDMLSGKTGSVTAVIPR